MVHLLYCTSVSIDKKSKRSHNITRFFLPFLLVDLMEGSGSVQNNGRSGSGGGPKNIWIRIHNIGTVTGYERK